MMRVPVAGAGLPRPEAEAGAPASGAPPTGPFTEGAAMRALSRFSVTATAHAHPAGR
jgi:hypothetical protein